MLAAGLASSESVSERGFPSSRSKLVPEFFQWFSMTAESKFLGCKKLYSWALEKQSSKQQERWSGPLFQRIIYSAKDVGLYKSSHVCNHLLLHFSNSIYSLPFSPPPKVSIYLLGAVKYGNSTTTTLVFILTVQVSYLLRD